MCMAVYAAADAPLPLVEWDTAQPAFNVHPLEPRDEPVRRHFTRPFVVFVGAHTGCACGFAYGAFAPRDDLERAEDARARASVTALRRYLTAAVAELGVVELFSCWEGDQGAEARHRLEVGPDHFGGEAFEFPEKAYFVVHRAPPGAAPRRRRSGRS
ncbi:MAG: hypothetical protein R2752_02300 [Vicinamibacterales bacterium]